MRVQRMVCGIVSLAAAACTASPAALAEAGNAETGERDRGEYLVNYGGCNDCHSPKVMTPNGPEPDKQRLLSGHPASAQLPPVPAGVIGANPDQWGALANNDLTAWAGPWGISFAANLTPDAATGLGAWTPELFIKTMRTGKHFGVGQPILPPMPWFALAELTDQDLKAVFVYLKSIKPIKNQVPRPVPPGV
jgi:mono/diheme cytochrome c family protein